MDGDHLDSRCTSGARASGKEDPSRQVSQVVHGNFYLATRHILEMTEGGLLKGLTQEEAERCVLDDMCVNFDHHVADLQG
jgi:hypothetical protein